MSAAVGESEVSPEKKVENSMPSDAIGLNNMGTELTAEGRHEDAVKAFTQALELVPGMAAAHVNLSITYERLNDLDNALSSAKLGVRYGPDYTRAYDQLCGVYFLQNNFSSAAEC